MVTPERYALQPSAAAQNRPTAEGSSALMFTWTGRSAMPKILCSRAPTSSGLARDAVARPAVPRPAGRRPLGAPVSAAVVAATWSCASGRPGRRCRRP
ncbi:hypothetical protein GPN2_12698 [Streptomyces murinus]